MILVRTILLAGAAAIVSTSALSADLPPVYHQGPVVEDFGGWYLRGDIGMSNQKVKRIHNILMDMLPSSAGDKVDSTARRLRRRRRLSIQQLDALRRHRRISRRRELPCDGSVFQSVHGRKRPDEDQRVHRGQIRMGGPGQRLFRSRHLVVPDAVRRRRPRVLARDDRPLTGTTAPSRVAAEFAVAASKWNFAWARMPAWPTRSRPDSPSSWPIAI